MSNFENAGERILQIPSYGIESIQPGVGVNISTEQMPWLAEDKEVSTVSVKCEDGTEFQFGSCVSGSGTLEKIAEKVPETESKKLEEALFKSLPNWLAGQSVANIDSVVLQHQGSLPLYIVGKRGKDAARLAFVRFREDDHTFILKTGISRHKDHTRMLAFMTKTSLKS